MTRISWGVFGVLAASVAAAEAPHFQREIRPILSEYCFQCHGFDEHARQGKLRLDQFAGATHAAESGAVAITPGHPDQSELIHRINSTDPALRMPPEETGKDLSPAQRELLRRWIESGAEYAQHWSLVKPTMPALPEVRLQAWPRNFIDRFVLHRIEQAGLTPSPPASPERLLRRVSLDLIGRPPTLEELDHYLAATTIDPDAAYLAEVDRLLASPHFGERMAIDWMDAARYADTNGYFGDKPRLAWPWRDWVIQAFNGNMPFDQFTIEQLAGDLLPEPTRDQRIATGFHRNSMANNETGIIDEEYRVEAVADRVETTSAIWLGMTIGCAQCHDHKYDPISQREYYQLFGFFNSSVEPGLVYADSPPPTLEVPTPEQTAHLASCQRLREEAERAFLAQSTTLDHDVAEWEKTATSELATLPADAIIQCRFDPVSPPFQTVGTTLQLVRGISGQAGSFDATQHVETATDFPLDEPWTISLWIHPIQSLCGVWSRIEPTGRRRGVELIWQKGKLQLNLVHEWGADEIAVTTETSLVANQWHHVLVSYDGARQASGVQIVTDGRPNPLTIHRDSLTGTLQNGEPFRIGRRDAGLGFYGLLDDFQILPRAVSSMDVLGWAESERLQGILAITPDQRSASEQLIVKEFFIKHHAHEEVRNRYELWQSARAAESKAKATIPTTLVMQDLPVPRETRLLIRGQYDKHGDVVPVGVPAVFPGLPEGAIQNRLTLARWIASPEHPLTARVTVNRLWQMLFGDGLVRTPNDFGSQGELPSHPELLDALAVEFVRHDWDVKQLIRFMVTSATYRQSSDSHPDLHQRDPENRWLARGPRFRLPAEIVRDQALAVSGLLSDRIGGPSVKPYQPDGLWEEVSFNEEDSYLVDSGDGPWRRSLYTYWKRQVPPPAMLSFDANTREKCVVQRSRTNTPLQALVTLNDTTYVEAARSLAMSILIDNPTASDRQRVQTMFRRVTSRNPAPEEEAVLLSLVKRESAAFAADPVAAEQLLSLGNSPRRSTTDAPELAAWTLVAQTILNLDEVITRR